MRLNFKNTKLYNPNPYNPSFQKLVKIDKAKIIYNLRVDKKNAVAKANAAAEAKIGLEEIAKKYNVKINVISAFQQPFISVKRKGLKSITDSARGIFAGNFADKFEKENILEMAQKTVENLTEQVANFTKNKVHL